MSISTDGFHIARPEVKPLLHEVCVYYSHWYVTVRGTRAELLAAGCASAEMFDLPPCGVRHTSDEFGNHAIVRALASARFEVRLLCDRDGDRMPRKWRESWDEAGERVRCLLLRFSTRAQS